MSSKILLVDLDGTLLDKQKVWQQIETGFCQRFGDCVDEDFSFHRFYRLHRGPEHSVNRALFAAETKLSIAARDLGQLFKDVNYEACFCGERWNDLQSLVTSRDESIAIFTQGTPWVQQAKREQLRVVMGKVPWHIYEQNKESHLSDLVGMYKGMGYQVTGVMDDLLPVVMEARRLGLEGFLMSPLGKEGLDCMEGGESGRVLEYWKPRRRIEG